MGEVRQWRPQWPRIGSFLPFWLEDFLLSQLFLGGGSQSSWEIHEAEILKDSALILPLGPQFPFFYRDSLSSHGPEIHFPLFQHPTAPRASLQVEELEWFSSLLEMKFFIPAAEMKMFHCLGAGKSFLQVSSSLSCPLRSGIGLSFWAYLLSSFYFPLSSVGLGDLNFYFPAFIFFFWSVIFGGRVPLFFLLRNHLPLSPFLPLST